MELRIGDKAVANPAEGDIVRALDAPSFPDDWTLTLDAGAAGQLRAAARPANRLMLAFVQGSQRRHAAHPVEAAAAKAVVLKFFRREPGWDHGFAWQTEQAAPKPHFVPAALTTLRGKDDSPPQWAIIAVVGVIGLVIAVFQLESFLPYWLRGSAWFNVGLIALPMVALVAAMAASKMIDLRRSRAWSTTTGTIVRSQMQSRRIHFEGDRADTIENVAAVEYEFTAGGRKVRGSRIGIGDDARGAGAAPALARYPVGKSVTVHYDPDDPARCVLERGGPDIGRKDMTGCARESVVLVLIGIGLWWLIVHGPAFLAARFPKSNPEVVLFATGFGVLLLMVFYAQRKMQKAASGWPSVRGTIVTSEVRAFRETVDGTHTTTYGPAVEFAYAVGGNDYRGSQIKLGVTVSGAQAYAESVVKKYPTGAAVDVHYDPANPGNAALENPARMTLILPALALGCFALAAWQLGIVR